MKYIYLVIFWKLEGNQADGFHAANVWTDHDDVTKWKHFPRYWPFVPRIYRPLVNSPHEGQWRGALMFFFYLHLNKRSSKHSRGWWFEKLSRPLWRYWNDKWKNENQVCVVVMMIHWIMFSGWKIAIFENSHVDLITNLKFVKMQHCRWMECI